MIALMVSPNGTGPSDRTFGLADTERDTVGAPSR
jgi:hypothetical protein